MHNKLVHSTASRLPPLYTAVFIACVYSLINITLLALVQSYYYTKTAVLRAVADQYPYLTRTRTRYYARPEYRTQLAKVSLDGIFDLTAAVCIVYYERKIHPSCEIEEFGETHLFKLCVILRSRVLRVVCPY